MTNNLHQRIEGCIAQQPRHPLSPIIDEGNSSIQDIALYQNINHVSQNVVLDVPQTSSFYVTSIKKNSYQSTDCCFSQKTRKSVSNYSRAER